jgi:hypothetical protein
MNYTIKKHKLLEILAIQNVNVQTGEAKVHVLGISYDEIHKKLNVTHNQLLTLTSELFENKEIGYHNAHNFEGLYAETKGIAAYSTKKYLKLNRKIAIDNIKDIIQIVIPVISLIVAVFAITLKIESFNHKNEERIENLEKRINSIEKSNSSRPTILLNDKNNKVIK